MSLAAELESVFRQAVAAVDPYAATRAAVASSNPDGQHVAILALGKAGLPMLRGAADALRDADATVLTALAVVDADGGGAPEFARVLEGDHPVPGNQSALAADAVEQWIASLPSVRVLVLLSGGTTSLLAAPIPEIPAADLRILFEQLLASGADIQTMNALRKRVLRYGAGRLARALAPRSVDQYVVSDVLGDDPAFIGSGPCTPDSLTAAKVRRMLERNEVLARIPASVVRYLDDVHHQRLPETPKPGTALFRAVHTRVLLSNRVAVAAAVSAATACGLSPVRAITEPLRGESRATGTELGARLVAWRTQLASSGHGTADVGCTVAGGETTVTLGDSGDGRGGRCQELALAAARELHRLRPRSDGVVLLAAGTDGRDGPTDAAGAIVDADTWSRIQQRGRDPEADLRSHNSYASLAAAGALLRTGPTGTNVNDLVIAAVPVARADSGPAA